ncbi:helix-turn-helix transcriptional regulator [Sphingomonas sp.]|uniref:helix-turn-helix transcriptional regulator n=1 Tax=Sphingomonas sp. TaxID=28214 RepID=UPI0025E7D881|nr:helix-turn-helix transcriptional regulator [Sphingomonas sp.]MBV9529340.1 hypothetical protein [Sphingomonas sp.]
MSLDERVSDLIKRIYRAGPDAREWDRIAVEILKVTGGNGALTTLTDLQNKELATYRAYGPEDTKFARGIEEYSERHIDDPSLRWAFENPSARFCYSHQTLRAEEYLQNDYVKWNLDHFGSTHWCVGYTGPADDLSFTFSLHFPAEDGPGSAVSRRLFRMLFDHMECAVRLQSRPFNTNSARALVVLDSTGQVQDLTATADALLTKAGALTIRDGHLVATLHSEQSKLDAAVASVGSAVSSGAPPTAVKLAQLNGRPWLITVRPLMDAYGPFGRVRTQLLIEIHHAAPRIDNLELVQSLFHLTAREIEIVRKLGEGHSVQSLSKAMNIRPNTARTHLRSIFAKTNTCRQSELLLLCASITRG